LFSLAIFAPLFTFSKFFIFDNTVTLVSALVELFEEGHLVLFIVILGFSVLLPYMKLVLLFLLGNHGVISAQRKRRLIHWMELIGKWSMLDVFVVAVLLVSIKMGPVVNIEVHWGLYAFSASVLLIMLISQWTASVARKMDK
jgi:paraquat-inducible protein A